MRAYIIPEFGAPGDIAEVPMPEPGEGEILVRVHAAAVNAMEPFIAAGYAKDYFEHRFPLVLGGDYAGTVTAVGRGAPGFEVGDEVFGDVGKAAVGEGTYAEYVAAAAGSAFHRPDALPVEVAAALPRAGGTAIAEIDAAALQPGDPVIVIGAGGGVGVIVTQLAARAGARVIAATSADKADMVRTLGATDVLDYAAPDLVDRLRVLTPDGAAVLIDNFHDAASLAPFAALVRPGGRVVSPVAMGADQALAGLPLTVHLVQAAFTRVGELTDLAADGSLRIPVQTLPLAQAGEALARQATRQVRGKLVLLVD